MRWLEKRLALAAAGVGVLLLLVGLSAVIVEGRLVSSAGYTLIAGLALVIAYVVLDPSAAVDLVRGRRARFGSLSVLVSAAVIGILVVVNVLASRSSQAADLTRSGLYTLSPKSELILKKLDSDLVVTGFFRPDQSDPRRQVKDLLSLYQQRSAHVKTHFEDPDQNAAHALSLGVTISGSIVMQYKNKPPVVLTLASQSESEVTGAILRLETNRTPTICWAAGDGERDLKDADQANGYTAAAELLKTSNYQTQDLLLSQQAQIPATCDVLAVVGVRRPLTDASVKAIQAFVASGGKLLFAFDPWPADPRIKASVNSLFAPYGVAFSGGLVVEGDTAHEAANDPTTPVAFDFASSPISKDLARKFVFFVQPTSITGQPAGSLQAVNLVTTTDKAFEIGQPRQSEQRTAADKAGPFVLMQTLEESQSSGKKSRVVMVGTSAIGENRALPPSSSGANPDLLLASLDWLSEQENLIGISPKPPAATPLSLTAAQERFNYLLTLILLPLLIIGAGVLVVVRRRMT